MRLRAKLLALVIAGPALAQADLSAWPLEAHPAEDYATAVAVFNAGNPATGGCLFYRAQYRYRVHLEARPGLDPSGDDALFAALGESVGRPINEWLGGDKADWLAAVDCAVAWVRANDDPLTPKAEFPEVHATVFAGLEDLRAMIDGLPVEQLRADRDAAGLPNR